MAARRSRPGVDAARRGSAGPARGWQVAGVVLAVVVQLVVLRAPVAASGPAETWTARTPASGHFWTSVTYGNGLFVAVASSGAGNRVMTSPDGITWTSRNSAADLSWNEVTYGTGIGFRQSITLTPEYLPETGADTDTPMSVAFVMLMTGLGVLAARRRYQDCSR